MPTRFPGMDPWLERPSLWPGVHARLISIFGELLTPQIRPRYFADIESRLYVLGEDDPARPLVMIPDLSRRAGGGGRSGEASAGAPTPASAVIDMHAEIPVREGRVVIRTPDGRDVISVLELLSPTNKTPGSRGRSEYLAKRRELLETPVHVVEVDLLRAGARFPSAAPLPRADYYVHVSRSQKRPTGEIWAWTVRDPAPRIPIPLRDGEADAILDLGAAIQLAYDRGGYDVAIDYRKYPEPPLSSGDAAWASALVDGEGAK